MYNKRKLITLNCSVATAPTDATSSISTGMNNGSHTPNTPDILNEIINISNDHLEEISKQMKTENENNMLNSTPCYVNPHSDIIGHYSRMIKQGLKLKVKEKIKTKSEENSSEKGKEILVNDHVRSFPFYNHNLCPICRI